MTAAKSDAELVEAMLKHTRPRGSQEDPGVDITEPSVPLDPETVEKLREEHGIELPDWKPTVRPSARSGHAEPIFRLLGSAAVLLRDQKPVDEGREAFYALLAENEELRRRLKLACEPCADCGHIDWRELDDILEAK